MKRVGVAIFLGSLVLGLGVVFALGMARPVTSDAIYFKELAVNMVEGKGYSVDSSFWPGEPSLRRMPGWPFAVAVAIKLLPMVSVDGLMRVLACLLHSVSALLVYALSVRLLGRGGVLPADVPTPFPTSIEPGPVGAGQV